MNGLISVVMPYRNAGSTIERALAGLLATDDRALEVLAVDDGSSDSGPERVRAWAARDDRVRPLSAARPGLVGALQTGVSAARGSLLGRMDADDVCHPERFARQRDALLAAPGLGLLACQVEAGSDAGTVGEGLSLYVAWQNSLVTPADHHRELFVESPLCHPSVLMRRAAYERAGGYQESDGPEDYALWLRFDAAGIPMAKLPERLLTWHHVAGRATFTSPRYQLARFREAKAPHVVRRVLGTGRRHVMWGAGPTGRRLSRELERHGFRPQAFIDIDPEKLGRTARGAPIVAASTLDAARDVVVVAVGARGARALIRPELEARGFREGEDYWFAS